MRREEREGEQTVGWELRGTGWNTEYGIMCKLIWSDLIWSDQIWSNLHVCASTQAPSEVKTGILVVLIIFALEKAVLFRFTTVHGKLRVIKIIMIG
jgi:hypothetical protein